MCAGEADAGARRVHRVGGRGGDRQARGCNVLRAVNGPSRSFAAYLRGDSLTALCEYLNMIEYAAEYGQGQSGAERDS